MKPLLREELKTLLQQQSSWCVSLYLPIDRTTAGRPADRTRLKNLLRQAREQLARNGLGDGATAALLAPADRLVIDDEFWRQPEAGLALFLSEQAAHTFQLHASPEETVVVARRFMLRPLLPILSDAERFYVLALSQNEARLLAGTRFALHAVSVKDMPRSEAEALRFDELQKQTQYHTVASPAGQGTYAVFHGQADTIDDAKERMQRYFRQIDHALRRTLPYNGFPLVIASVDYLLPLYRQVNSYPHLLAESIHGNPDEMSNADLLRAAWSIVAPYSMTAQDNALSVFRRYEGTARASTQVEQIVRAAYAGRVESLFVAAGEQRWGMYDPTLDSVQLSAQPEPGDDDLLDLAAMQSIAANGSVYVLPSEQMPSRLPIAAVFRY
jgi:hypothetical protein